MPNPYRSLPGAVALLSALALGCSSSSSGLQPGGEDGVMDGTGGTLASAPGGRDGAIGDGGLRAPDAPWDRGAPRPEVTAATEAGVDTTGASEGGPPAAVAAAPQCLKDADCMLVNDCCTCAALPRGERPPACDPKMACLIPSCTQYGGIEQVRCVAGRCILGFDCDATTVNCRRSAPMCPPGQVPRVVTLGNQRCYGECVDARQCLAVPSCMSCARGDLCVKYAPSPQPLHCVPRPPSCGREDGCGCVAPAVCTGAYGVCHNGAAPNPAITCECPTC